MDKKIVDYHYIDCGLKNIILKKMELFVCLKCGEEEIVIPNIQQLHQLIFQDCKHVPT